MNKDYLDFFVLAGNILKSSSSCLKKINMILIMMMEYFEIRNPVLIIQDNITHEQNIELAPELTKEELNKAKHMLNEYMSSFPHTFCHKLVLTAKEAGRIPLILPEDLKNNYEVFISHPITGHGRNSQLGILFAFIEKGKPFSNNVNMLNIIVDIIGFFLDTQPCCHVQYTREFTRKETPMVLEGTVGASAVMKNIGETIRKISASRASVFILGESGTGKELIAKAIHKYSLRNCAPFITINCAALSDELLGSELFGHVKGSFTGAIRTKIGRFEEADGGTLFLDEIGDTSLNFQKKLLHVLQEGEFEPLGSNRTIKVDVRIICATNADIENAIQKGSFREDLYYRLNVISLKVPSLNERKNDIPLLADYFLMKLNQEYVKSVKISEKTAQLLQEMDWPGNVRQLENFVHSAFVMAKDGFISLESTLNHYNPVELSPAPVSMNANKKEFQKNPNVKSDLELREIQAIEIALKASKGIQVKAARLLSISLRQLRYRIKKYGVEVKKIRM